MKNNNVFDSQYVLQNASINELSNQYSSSLGQVPFLLYSQNFSRLGSIPQIISSGVDPRILITLQESLPGVDLVSIIQNIYEKTEDVQLTANEVESNLIIANTTGSARTLTVPELSSNEDKYTFLMVRSGSNSLTFAEAGSYQIKYPNGTGSYSFENDGDGAWVVYRNDDSTFYIFPRSTALNRGTYDNQILTWDGSNWTPFGFRDTFDVDGDDTALDARWVTKTLPGSANVSISSNVCTITTDSGASNSTIATGEWATAPLFISCYAQLTVAPNTGDSARFHFYKDVPNYLGMVIRKDGSNFKITAEDRSTIRGNYDLGGNIADAKAWIGAVVDKYTIRFLYSLNAADSRPKHWEWVQLYSGNTPSSMSGAVLEIIVGSAGGGTQGKFQSIEVARPY